MSDYLVIAGPETADERLVEEIARRHPDRVTVLVEHDVLAEDDEAGDRLARLIASIERRTGAIVVGLAGSREQLRGWRFDRVVGGSSALPV